MAAKGAVAGGFEKVCQGSARQRTDDGVDQPADAERSGPGQRDGLALDVHAAILLLQTPVGSQPPDDGAFLARVQLALRGFLRNPYRPAPDGCGMTLTELAPRRKELSRAVDYTMIPSLVTNSAYGSTGASMHSWNAEAGRAANCSASFGSHLPLSASWRISARASEWRNPGL